MNGEINWGPEIRVDGVRPGWLGDDEKFQWASISEKYDWWRLYSFSGYTNARGMNWDGIPYIRLPADHPHYATLGHATAPNGGEVGPEVVERIIGVVRELAARDNGDGTVSIVDIQRTVADAVELVALLPEPVDGDLVEARRIEYEICEEQGIDPEPALRGEWDDKPGVRGVLRAIKRGRALEKEAGR